MMDEQTKADINKCLIGVKNRDVESLNRLYYLIGYYIRYISFKYIHYDVDAEDLEQDFWADIYVFADKYNYIGNAYGYLCKIMNNLARNRYVKLYGEKKYVIRVVDYNQIHRYDESQSMDAVDTRISLQTALNKLDPTKQKIIQLWCFEHKTLVEIAKELKISKSQVDRKKKAAYADLGSELSEIFWEKSEG